ISSRRNAHRPLWTSCRPLGGRRGAPLATSVLGPQLKPALVLFEEIAQVVGRVEQPDPLLVVECHREAPQAVDAHASLFSDAKFEAAFGPCAGLLFELRDASQQFFF